MGLNNEVTLSTEDTERDENASDFLNLVGRVPPYGAWGSAQHGPTAAPGLFMRKGESVGNAAKCGHDT